MFFLQICFLRVAYDQGTVKVVAQKEVEGVRVLAPEEVRCDEPDEQRYFKGQEGQKTFTGRGRPTAQACFFCKLAF